MSAGPFGLLASESARIPSHVTRSPLRLVASHGVLRSQLDLPSASTCASATRLNRRGRLVMSLMVAFAVAALALLLAASVDAAAPQIDHATTVSTGQTLSEVAAAQLPDLPVPDAVARIQLANDLSTSQVHAGQRLLIPEMP